MDPPPARRPLQLPPEVQQTILATPANNEHLHLPYEFTVNGVDITTSDDGRALRSWLCAWPRDEFEVFERVRPPPRNPSATRRVWQRLALAVDHYPVRPSEAQCRTLVEQLRAAFDQQCRAVENAMTLIIHDEARARLFLVCDKLYCDDPAAVRRLGGWLCESDAVEGQPADDWHPLIEQRMPLPNSARCRAVALFDLNSATLRSPALSADDLFACASLTTTEAPSRWNPPFDLRTRRFSAAFTAFAARYARRVDPSVLENANDAELEYKARIEETRKGRIDLSDIDTSFRWRGGLMINTQKRCQLLRDQNDAAYLFVELRAWLDQMFAFNPAKKLFYYKHTDEDGEVLYSTTASLDMFFSRKIPLGTVPAPAEGSPLRAVVMSYDPKEKNPKAPKSATLDLVKWYIAIGVRAVSGVMFRPYGFNEPPSASQDDYINTFRGFNAHRLIREATPEQRLWARSRRQLLHTQVDDAREPIRNLAFLLRHVAYLMGEDMPVIEKVTADGGLDTATGQFLGWLAKMIFRPTQKLARYYVLQSAPGRGKSMFINAFGNKMLHSAHYGVFRDINMLVEHFNGHLNEKILTSIEEANLDDLNDKGMRQLKEAVSCERENLRQLYSDGRMVKVYRHIIIPTNVKLPMRVSPDDRRGYLARFNQKISTKMDEEPDFKLEYDERLKCAVEDESAWRCFALVLDAVYNNPDADRAFMRTATCTQRALNFDTLHAQLESLAMARDRSVLGWLYLHLVYLRDFLDKSVLQEHYVYPSGGNRSHHAFMSWPTHMQLCERPPNGFTGSWAHPIFDLPPGATSADVCAERRRRTNGWWTRARRSDFLDSYHKSGIHQRYWLSEAEWIEQCRAVFRAWLPSDTGAGNTRNFLFETDVMDSHGVLQPVWCIAPLPDLEDLFMTLIPNVSSSFNWDTYRESHEAHRKTALWS